MESVVHTVQSFLAMEPKGLYHDVVAGVLGVCVGSFLNVLALRSLEERSLFHPPSCCPHCAARLGVQDLIPVVSWLALRGKCRHCSKPISWQYPAVEIITAIAFIVVLRHFGWTFEGLGMVFFACTLIAVCVTDFREKLIPHEITYPAMMIGLIYNGVCQNWQGLNPYDEGKMHLSDAHNLMACLAGIGISYILFDFLAFYGLKLYMRMHGDQHQLPEPYTTPTADEETDADAQIDTTFDIRPPAPLPEEELEVMGGGDAVLSAVIAAWLGLSRLGISLLFGFLIGTAMGAVYLVLEMKRQKLLGLCVKPALLGGAGLFTLVESMLYLLYRLGPGLHPENSFFATMPWWQVGIVSLLCGALLGVIRVGQRVSKPFPFGPALAIGAAIAMFYEQLATPWSGGA